MNAERVRIQTLHWIETIVIGLDLCPFALRSIDALPPFGLTRYLTEFYLSAVGNSQLQSPILSEIETNARFMEMSPLGYKESGAHGL
jgi:hypothetical protein